MCVCRALIPADSSLCFLRVSESLVLNRASRALRASSMANAPSLAAAADIGFRKQPIGPSRQLVIFLLNVNPPADATPPAAGPAPAPGPLPRVAAGAESERGAPCARPPPSRAHGRDAGETAGCAPAVEEETSCCASATSCCAPAVEEESCCTVAKGQLARCAASVAP